MSCTFEKINWLISQSTTVPCHQLKQCCMNQLQELENQPGFIRSLVRLLDFQDMGGRTKWEDRQLAAILLKNTVLKLIQNEETRKTFQDDINVVKSFLLRSFGEPQHQVFIQLHVLTAKLARIYWPNDWNELIPAIVSNIGMEKEFMNSFEATCCLHEILVELQCKATSGPFYRTFYELCLQLFVVMSKNWAIRMKSVQNYVTTFTNLATQVPSSSSPSSSSSTTFNFSFPRDESQETNIYYAMVLSKIIKILIEMCYVDILKKFPCFSCLWKTYMGTIQLMATFIRKIRPTFIKLIEEIKSTRHNPSASQLNSSNGGQFQITNPDSNQAITLKTLEKFYALDLDDVNYSCDYYLPMNELTSYPQQIGLFVVINLVMKLLKILNCLPIHIQKKYPIDCIPFIENLIQFYFKFLIDEVSIDINQNHHLAFLPLTAISQAGMLFLSNTLQCSAYSDYQCYRMIQQKQQNEMQLSEECCLSSTMDPSTIESNIVAVNDLLREFFIPVRVKELLERILAFTMHYSENALMIWAEQPEKFFIDEESENMDYSYLRIASEKLFLSLLSIQPQTIIEIMMNLLQDVNRQNAVTSLGMNNNNEILLWDAIYTSAGLAVESLAKNLGLSPTDWLLGIIGPLFSNLLQSNRCGSLQPYGQQLLRSRMLKLISAWITQFDVKVHSTILHFLVSLLSCSSNSDVVVQLSTVKTLSSLINTKNFDYKSLVPIALPCISALIELIQSLQESETKLNVLTLMKDIIEMVGIQIHSTEFANLLMNSLCHLWNSLSSDDIIRPSVLEIMISSVHSFKNKIDSSYLIQMIILCSDCIRNQYQQTSTNNYCLRQKQQPQQPTEPMNSSPTSSMNNQHLRLGNLNKQACCDDSSLLLESLLLLVAIVRNVSENTHWILYDYLVGSLQSCYIHVFYQKMETNIFFPTYGETNGKLIVDRFCYFIEGLAVNFPKQFFTSEKPKQPILPQELPSIPTALSIFGGCSSLSKPSTAAPSSSFIVNPELSVKSIIQDCYSHFLKFIEPRLLGMVLRSMEYMFLISPNHAVNLFLETDCFLIIFKVCASNAPCPNLSGLMKRYQGGTMITISAVNIIMNVLLINPLVLMKILGIIKEEILQFLYQSRGVISTNLTESLLVDEFVSVLCKTIPHFAFTLNHDEEVDNKEINTHGEEQQEGEERNHNENIPRNNLNKTSSGSCMIVSLENTMCPYRLRTFCLGLWSFIAPTKGSTTTTATAASMLFLSSSTTNSSASTTPIPASLSQQSQNNDPATSSSSSSSSSSSADNSPEFFIPNLLSQEKLNKWFPNIFKLTALYLRSCEDLFHDKHDAFHSTNHLTDWKSILYSYTTSMMKGPFPMPSPEEIQWNPNHRASSLIETMDYERLLLVPPAIIQSSSSTPEITRKQYIQVMNPMELYDKICGLLVYQDQLFHAFLQETLMRPGMNEISPVDDSSLSQRMMMMMEKEEIFVSSVYHAVSQYHLTNISFEQFFVERSHTIMNVYGRDYYFSLLKNAFQLNES